MVDYRVIFRILFCLMCGKADEFTYILTFNKLLRIFHNRANIANCKPLEQTV